MFQTNVVEKMKTYNLCSKTFSPGNRAVYEMWKHIVQPGRPQMIIWRMRTASLTPKATNTQSENAPIIAESCYLLHVKMLVN